MAAMMDANESLIIEGEPLKTENGGLIKNRVNFLLTGQEACREYGDPCSLLGFGIFETVEDLMDERYGENHGNLKRWRSIGRKKPDFGSAV